jgi:hypothetical protein
LQYKNGEHIASKCNNVKVCALPPIHLPLTREARVMAIFDGLCGFGGVGAGQSWWCGNPSGRRPNFIGRQHLTFDKGRAWMPEVERPKFCRTQNKQSVHKARVMAIFDG